MATFLLGVARYGEWAQALFRSRVLFHAPKRAWAPSAGARHWPRAALLPGPLCDWFVLANRVQAELGFTNAECAVALRESLGGGQTASRKDFAVSRSTETSWEMPRSAMVTPNSRFIRIMVIG